MLMNANKTMPMSNHANKNNANGRKYANDLVYAELSYKIMGVLFNIHNSLGPNHPEKHYQKAIEIELKNMNIPFEREKLVRLEYKEQSIGRYFLDFVIDQKIALEVKTIDFFGKAEWRQVRDYLNSEHLKLAILVNFSKPRLTFKRVLNANIKLIESDSHIGVDSQTKD